MNIYKKLLINVFLILMLTNCGGGGEPTNNIVNEDITTIQSVPSTITGGSADSPTLISLEFVNEISSNNFFNYFKYIAKKNEKIIIYSNLNYPHTALDRSRCSAAGNLPSNIKIYDSGFANVIGGTCGISLDYTFPKEGTYLFQFDYGTSNFGNFHAASIFTKTLTTSRESINGSPNAPRELKQDHNNIISTNAFYNYFFYKGEKGEKILIHTTLDQQLTVLQRSRCSSAGNPPSNIKIYDSSFSNVIGGTCGVDLTYTFPENDTYIFYFDYYTDNSRNSGYFNFTPL